MMPISSMPVGVAIRFFRSRRPSDTVFLQGGTQFVVFNKLSRRLHGTQQRRLGVKLGRCGPLLRQTRHVRSALAFYERWQCALLIILFRVIFFGLRQHIFGVYRTPTGIENGLSSHLELHVQTH